MKDSKKPPQPGPLPAPQLRWPIRPEVSRSPVVQVPKAVTPQARSQPSPLSVSQAKRPAANLPVRSSPAPPPVFYPRPLPGVTQPKVPVPGRSAPAPPPVHYPRPLPGPAEAKAPGHGQHPSASTRQSRPRAIPPVHESNPGKPVQAKRGLVIPSRKMPAPPPVFRPQPFPKSGLPFFASSTLQRALATPSLVSTDVNEFCRKNNLSLAEWEILISYDPDAIRGTLATQGSSEERERAQSMSSPELLGWAVGRNLPGSCGNTANLLQELNSGNLLAEGDEKTLRSALTKMDNILCRVDLGENHSFVIEKVNGRIQMLQSFFGSQSLASCLGGVKDRKINDVMRVVKGSTQLGVKCTVKIFEKADPVTVEGRLTDQLRTAQERWR